MNVESKNDKEKPFVDAKALMNDFTDSEDNDVRGLFGKEDNIKVLGDEESEVPSELIDVLRNSGFGDAGSGTGSSRSAFRIMLKQMKPGGSDYRSATFIHQFKTREIPTVQHVAEEYGSGDYVMVVRYEALDDETLKRKAHFLPVYFSISEKIEPARRKLLRERKLKEIQKHKQQFRDMKEEDFIEDQIGFGEKPVDEAEAGKRYLQNLMEANKALGLSPGNNNGTNWGEILTRTLALVAPALPSIIGMLSERSKAERDRMDKFMMLMMNTKDQSQNQIIELLQKQSSGSGNIMEAMDMVARMVDFKKELSEEKETIVDKIMSMVEVAAPMLGPLLAQPAARRERNPLYQQAQNMMANNPEIQQAKNDPEILAHIVKNLDEKTGDRNKTDAILAAAGVVRPGNAQPANDYEDAQFEEDGDNEEAGQV